ncbi:MAG: NAD-dependent epimerase/dehydratase family protein [Gemmataceae bacterium]
MNTSLVTGGAGFIGSHLVETLLAAGRRVIVIDDLSTGTLTNLARVQNDPGLRIVTGTITNEPLIESLIHEADDIYHLAAVVGVRLILEEPVRTAQINNDATATILRLAAQTAKPIFLASTSEVYGKNPKMPLNEDDDCILGPTSKGRWIYACGKALDDHLALGYYRRTGLPVVIGRFFNTVGPRQVGHYGMVLPRFVDQALSGGPLKVYGDGEQVRCFGHVADVVRAILDLMACPQAKGKVFNLGNDEPVTIQGLAERVAGQVNPLLAIEKVPYSQIYGAEFEDIRRRVPDLTRIRTTIGYQPKHGLDDIIRHVIAWKEQAKSIPSIHQGGLEPNLSTSAAGFVVGAPA